jgi:DNA-directed RNA polymerase subunit RPC12/RpoP
MLICSICQKEYEGYGNNAEPVNEGRCCDHCNSTVVIPARIHRLKELGTATADRAVTPFVERTE